MKKEIYKEITEERSEQDLKWGEQNHSPLIWLSILMEEVGEVAKEITRSIDNNPGIDEFRYREELIQCAAVCVAMIECLDRNTNEN